MYCFSGDVNMQNREKILKEINDVQLQLNIVETAATITVSDEEKEHWNEKRAVLQARLETLRNQLDEESNESVAVIDDETADAMLDGILRVQEDNEFAGAVPVADGAESDATDKMADAMFARILNADESDLAVSDNAMQGEILFDADKADGKETADVMANAIIGNILATNEPATIDDETADAMLDAILSAVAPEETAEKSEKSAESVMAIPSEPMAEQPLNKVLQAEKAPEEKIVPMQEPAKTDSDERLTLQTVDPTIANEILREIMAANERIAEVERTMRTVDGAAFARKAAEPEIDSDTSKQIETLRAEADEANRRAQAALAEAEKLKKEAEQIKLAAETERAMYAAEMELQRGTRSAEETMRVANEQAAKDKLAEKIARRKAEITAIRNGLQDVKDTDSAFLLREKLFSVQLVLDEEERNSPEITYLLTKSMDDVSHALEVAELKRRIAVLTAAPRPAPKSPVKKAAPKKKPTAKKKPAKKKRAVAAKKRPPARPMHPPAKRRYMPRPSPYSPRYYR